MADVATPPAAEAPQGKQQFVKPEKPDEDKYKEDLAKAEKEHAAAQDKLVGFPQSLFPHAARAMSGPVGATRRELPSQDSVPL